MPDLISEQRISLTQLAHEQGVSLTTVWRWVQAGRRGHRLEAFHVGGRKYTTLPAFSRWLKATNPDQPSLASIRSAARQRQIDAANQVLEKAGLLPTKVVKESLSAALSTPTNASSSANRRSNRPPAA